jgi:hypothetical protein
MHRAWERRETYAKFLSEETVRAGCGRECNIRMIEKKLDGRVWAVFIWSRTGSGALMNTVMNLQVS